MEQLICPCGKFIELAKNISVRCLDARYAETIKDVAMCFIMVVTPFDPHLLFPCAHMDHSGNVISVGLAVALRQDNRVQSDRQVAQSGSSSRNS